MILPLSLLPMRSKNNAAELNSHPLETERKAQALEPQNPLSQIRLLVALKEKSALASARFTAVTHDNFTSVSQY